MFEIFFSVLLSYAFGSYFEGIGLQTRSDGKYFNLAHHHAKTKRQKSPHREMLFIDDTALAADMQKGPQHLMDRFSKVCTEFGLTISSKNPVIMGQDVYTFPFISINSPMLVFVNNFTYSIWAPSSP